MSYTLLKQVQLKASESLTVGLAMLWSFTVASGGQTGTVDQLCIHSREEQFMSEYATLSMYVY